MRRNRRREGTRERANVGLSVGERQAGGHQTNHECRCEPSTNLCPCVAHAKLRGRPDACSAKHRKRRWDGCGSSAAVQQAQSPLPAREWASPDLEGARVGADIAYGKDMRETQVRGSRKPRRELICRRAADRLRREDLPAAALATDVQQLPS